MLTFTCVYAHHNVMCIYMYMCLYALINDAALVGKVKFNQTISEQVKWMIVRTVYFEHLT